MGLNCGCPAGKHLNDLEIAECKESFGQIQKVIITRIFRSTGTKNKLPKATVTTKATMTPLLTASNGTKLIVSPYIQNPTTEPGEARTFGGGNQTLGGIEIVIGREPILLVLFIRKLSLLLRHSSLIHVKRLVYF